MDRLTNDFIEKANKVHGSKYDYKNAKYINNKTKVKIYCKVCKKYFLQRPNNHLHGQGCKTCGFKRTFDSQRKTTEEFIAESIRIHGNIYDYSKAKYTNNKEKVKIYCKICKEYFTQTPSAHIRQKQGCPKCGAKRTSNSKRSTTDDFIRKAKDIHDNKYDYSKVEYIDTYTKVTIICKKHGVFEQKPNDHIQGNGCPKCKSSKGELKIEKYLKENNINFESQKTFKGCEYKKLLKFDFYLPDYNICVEFDGRQHFMPVKFKKMSLKKAKTEFKDTQIRDKIKTKYCEDSDIILLRISYTNFEKIENILKTTLDRKTKV